MKFDPEVNPILEHIKAIIEPEKTREYALYNAVSFYNRKKYFETHEILEFQWRKEVGDKKRYLQALIQICIVMHKLYIHINLKGAYSQANLALEKLSDLKSKSCFTEMGIENTLMLIESLSHLLKILHADTVDYSYYSPPEFLFEFDRLFL